MTEKLCSAFQMRRKCFHFMHIPTILGVSRKSHTTIIQLSIEYNRRQLEINHGSEIFFNHRETISWAPGLQSHWVRASNACEWTQITMFMGPTWGPSGADRTKVGPMYITNTTTLGRHSTKVKYMWKLCIDQSAHGCYIWSNVIGVIDVIKEILIIKIFFRQRSACRIRPRICRGDSVDFIASQGISDKSNLLLHNITWGCIPFWGQCGPTK